MDKRLDKVLPVLTEAIYKLLNAKGMMKYREQMEKEIEKAMLVKLDSMNLDLNPEELRKKNPVQLAGIARKMGLTPNKKAKKPELFEMIVGANDIMN